MTSIEEIDAKIDAILANPNYKSLLQQSRGPQEDQALQCFNLQLKSWELRKVELIKARGPVAAPASPVRPGVKTQTGVMIQPQRNTPAPAAPREPLFKPMSPIGKAVSAGTGKSGRAITPSGLSQVDPASLTASRQLAGLDGHAKARAPVTGDEYTPAQALAIQRGHTAADPRSIYQDDLEDLAAFNEPIEALPEPAPEPVAETKRTRKARK